MQKLKSSWTNVAAITAVLCFLLGVCFRPITQGLEREQAHLAAMMQVRKIDSDYRRLHSPPAVYPKIQ